MITHDPDRLVLPNPPPLPPSEWLAHFAQINEEPLSCPIRHDHEGVIWSACLPRDSAVAAFVQGELDPTSRDLHAAFASVEPRDFKPGKENALRSTLRKAQEPAPASLLVARHWLIGKLLYHGYCDEGEAHAPAEVMLHLRGPSVRLGGPMLLRVLVAFKGAFMLEVRRLDYPFAEGPITNIPTAQHVLFLRDQPDRFVLLGPVRPDDNEPPSIYL